MELNWNSWLRYFDTKQFLMKKAWPHFVVLVLTNRFKILTIIIIRALCQPIKLYNDFDYARKFTNLEFVKVFGVISGLVMRIWSRCVIFGPPIYMFVFVFIINLKKVCFFSLTVGFMKEKLMNMKRGTLTTWHKVSLQFTYNRSL